MPRSSIGECVPDVTSPPPAIAMPLRGTAVSSRIAGAVDHALDPVDLAFRERELASLGQTQSLDRARPLDCEQGVVVRDVPNVGARKLALLQPGAVRLAVRRIHDQEVTEV